jgi:8-amino-7-oxononanoate synthase
MATLGKACGTFGAFVAGDEDLIETLIQHARTYIYTTAPPPALAWATRAALRQLQQAEERRRHLRDLIRRFRDGAAQRGLPVGASDTPIQPVIVGDAATASGLSDALRRQGVLVTAIRPPTVPRGSARLRVTFSADHTGADVECLLDALGNAYGELNP